MMIKVLAANVETLKSKDMFDIAYALVSKQRQEKVCRYALLQDKCLSLGAEVLLMYALNSAKINIPIEYCYGENNKPYLKNTGKAFFSIAHSKEWVVCALSDAEVGCDIEKVRNIDLGVAKRFFTSEEYTNIFNMPNKLLQNELFFRYWTLKESLMKATGKGMRLVPSAFEIVFGDRIACSYDIKYKFKEFSDVLGYKCAICYEENCDDVKLDIVDLSDCIKEIKK